MRSALSTCGLAAALVVLAGCSETELSQSLRSLERSGAVSFVCLNPEAEANPGRSLDDCPDFNGDDAEDRDLYALVTQTLRGEVAVVDLDHGGVLDSDTGVPGLTFLPVGPNPVDITSTPGGTATFVAAAGGPGEQGIFALPTSCIRVPEDDEPPRDLVTWPSCSLPSAPGRLVVLVDPPNAAGEVRSACDGAYGPVDGGGGTLDCEADLSLEVNPPGRRKLAVTLPDVGELWILDAQTLLDAPGGAFAPCVVERVVSLAVEERPGDLQQQVPADLAADPSCLPSLNYGPAGGPFRPRPAAVDLADEVLYVADLAAPVVHRIDVSDPCAPTEQPALFPLSYEEPGRTVFTSDLAVSALTAQRKRFVYAIDDQVGGVMIFDVSPASTNRTPIVREGGQRLPFEAPDRIRFAAPAKAVELVTRDLAESDPETGVAEYGVLCDPDPALDPNSDAPAVEYRTSDDYSTGARPTRLRGTFGLVGLTNGDVAVIDVEDFDAPCRRPTETNPTDAEDFRGCAGDPTVPGGLYTVDGTTDGDRTTSGEASCRIFEEHRARSATYFASGSDTGVSAPSLRTFPQLRDPEGRSLPTNQTEEGLRSPKVLAVDFASGQPAEVYVGTTRYGSALDENHLDTDPTVAEQGSLTFLMREPRAFVPVDSGAAVYEGVVVAERDVAFLEVLGDTARLSDAGGVFCDRGVEDVELGRETGRGIGVPAARLDEYAAWHGDYVQVTAPLPAADDHYWDVQTCGGANLFYTCEEMFGTPEDPQQARDLTVLQAYQDHVLVTPRGSADSGARAELLRQLDCCFGGEALSYVVRGGRQWVVSSAAGGIQHNITTAVVEDGLRCVRDCNPRRAFLQGRAHEIADATHVAASDGLIEACGEGECLGCVLAAPGPVAPDSPCVYQGLTTRFAIYRGTQRSVRDMVFGWEYSGGFSALSVSTAADTTSVSPQRMFWLPQTQNVVVTDGAAQGLVLIELDSVAVRRSFY